MIDSLNTDSEEGTIALFAPLKYAPGKLDSKVLKMFHGVYSQAIDLMRVDRKRSFS
jgi:hypothetical protein